MLPLSLDIFMIPSDPPDDDQDRAREARLNELRTRFLSTLSTRVGMILLQVRAVRVGAWPGPDSETLQNEVHGLAGSAGLFGQDRIGDAAAAIERVLSGFSKRRTVTAVDLAQLREAARKLDAAYVEANPAS
jgi:HPt (histidine-containing phosphotransfer) domain-containing protein